MSRTSTWPSAWARPAVEQLEERDTPSVTVRFDYRFDTAGFLDAPDRRATLERAAADLTAGMRDDLAAVVPSGWQTWVANTVRPDTGETVRVPDLAIPRGVVLLFVGGRPLPGPAAAHAVSLTPGEYAYGTPAWVDQVRGRGQAGALGDAPTDTALWGGSVTFDTGPDWYFGPDDAGLGPDQMDFYSVALHELVHAFGFAETNPAFRRWVSGDSFHGPSAVAVNGGPVPTERGHFETSETGERVRSAPSHWSQGAASGGRTPAMSPVIGPGERRPLTALDRAGLRDVGWDIDVPTALPPSPASDAVSPTAPRPASTPPTAIGGPAPSAAGADQGGTPSGRVGQPAGAVQPAAAPLPGVTGGVWTATAHFNADGVADGVVGTGPGGPGRVRVLDGATGAELFAVEPFEASFTGGVFVAAGDVTGDGVADLVVTPGDGGGPRVRVFSGAGFGLVADFLGIDDPNFRGGARTAVGDVTGDGSGDLVVAAGPGGGPRVAVFDGTTVAASSPGHACPDFFAGDPADRGGVRVAARDLDGDGRADLVAGSENGEPAQVQVYRAETLLSARTPSPDPFAGTDPTHGAFVG